LTLIRLLPRLFYLLELHSTRHLDLPYEFEQKETSITKIDRVAVFVEEGKLSQIRLKFDIEDWPYHTDLNLLYPEHRQKLPSQLEDLVREIEEEVKLALR